MLINIAPLGKIKFSSKSRWSLDDDHLEIVNPTHDRSYSFHTDKESAPWIVVDLGLVCPIKKIRVTNRLDACEYKAKTLRIEYYKSLSEQSIVLFESNTNWGKELALNSEITCRYLKLSLQEMEFFHLKRIEIFTDVNFVFDSNFCINNLLALQNIEHIFGMLLKDNRPSFNYNFSECSICLNTDSSIDFYRFDNNKKWMSNVKYSLKARDGELTFFINLQIPNFLIKEGREFEFTLLVNKLSSKFNLLVISDPANNLLQIYTKDHVSLHEQIEILFYKLWEIINSIYYILYASSLRNNNSTQKTILIDSDGIAIGCGFADRLRGILTLIEQCKKQNIDFQIKFTSPFNLSKYYSFKEFNDDSSVTKDQDYRVEFLPTECRSIVDDFLNIFTSIYGSISISTNENGYFNQNTFVQNFKRTEFLSIELAKYKKIIGGEYVSISLRFAGVLGDFKEVASFKILDESEQISLMNKCKNEIIKFMKDRLLGTKVLVLSDSTKFLKFIQKIPGIYVFPEHICHTSSIVNQNTENTEKSFLKTLIDFNLIMEARESYRFETQYLYPTNFPNIATKCVDRKLVIHKF